MVEELRAAGAAGVCVNLGGDLRAEGRAPGGGSWVVGIEHPLRHFSLVNVLVPLTGDWHPLAVAWGIAGMYLLLAVELTSLARPGFPGGCGGGFTTPASPCT